jgi:hypothetical protein
VISLIVSTGLVIKKVDGSNLGGLVGDNLIKINSFMGCISGMANGYGNNWNDF